MPLADRKRAENWIFPFFFLIKLTNEKENTLKRETCANCWLYDSFADVSYCRAFNGIIGFISCVLMIQILGFLEKEGKAISELAQ